MNITNKVLFSCLISSSLMFAACSEQKADIAQNKTSETTSSATIQGNWKSKATELSTANATEITTDLAQLNQIVNHANTQALQLRAELQSAAPQPEKRQHILLKANDIQAKTQQQIMALNLKSSEVQSLRTQMIDNLITSQKMYTLSTAPDFDANAPSDEFEQLGKRSMALQQKISAEMDALNQHYGK
ncbi:MULTISPECIES: hypothetical protein [Acinetobacter]|uniref:hypothetical protein n=1 Tax=Acinetobacter TaxID=469 RepID=UPI00141BD5A7|nr:MULTISPECIES: hypothetical protein [Acinetobacter]MCS4298643.1 hypothetical protein [Acinetobacter guillouiae]MCW2252247.1 hypothetical protein [Acinetobacter sp. BIGb0204]NII38307.1 hypothetical protein [Acinetobacter sp. BIGb0196]